MLYSLIVKNQIILSSGSLYSYGLNRFFELAKKAGFDEIEICPDSRFDTQDPGYIKKLSRGYSIKVVSLHYMMEFFGVWGDYKERIDKSIDLAKKLGAKFLVVHSWEYSDKVYVDWIIKNQSKISAKAAPVKIVFENSTKSYLPEDPKKLMSDNFKAENMMQFENVLMDTSHVATTKLDIVDFYNKLKDKIKYIHFSDSDYKLRDDRPNSIEDRHLAPGKGKLPLKEFLRNLKKSDYKGIISIELLPSSIGAELGEKEVVKNLKRAKKFVESNFI